MPLQDQMLEQARAAQDEINNVRIRIEGVKANAETMKTTLDQIGHTILVGQADKVIAACDKALTPILAAQEELAQVSWMVINAGGEAT